MGIRRTSYITTRLVKDVNWAAKCKGGSRQGQPKREQRARLVGTRSPMNVSTISLGGGFQGGAFSRSRIPIKLSI